MTKTALVLSGGGSRGGYEIGVWKALNELGIKPDIVTGTSVGAINSAMIAQGDLELAERLWSNLETEMIFDIEDSLPVENDPEKASLKDFLREKFQSLDIGGMPAEDALAYAKEIVVNGGAGNSGLRGILEKYISEDKVRKSSIDYGLVTTEFPSLKGRFLFADEIPSGKLIDFIIASASCFPAVQKCIIDDTSYIDGGYTDNLPVEMAINKGAEKIIAVDLQAAGIIRINTIKSAEKVLNDFKIIKSNLDLGNFLIFDRDNTSKIIRMGYLDTMRQFDMYDGLHYTFEKGSLKKHQIKGADYAAEAFKIDPLEIYTKEKLCKALSESIKPFATAIDNLKFPQLSMPTDIMDNFLDIMKDSDFKIKLLFIIADSLKKEEENSIFIQSKVYKLLSEEVQAANFLLREHIL